MITRLVMLEATDYTVELPIVQDVVKDLKKEVFRDVDNDLDVYIYKDNEPYDNDITTNEIGRNNLLVNYTCEEGDILAYNPGIYRAKEKVILRDKQTGFSIRPITTPTDLTINFTYKNKSKIVMQKILNRLKSLYKFTGYNLSHRLSYSYLFPKPLIHLIKDMATLLNKDMYTFIDESAIVKFDYAVKRGSDYKVPSFRGVQGGIVGNILDDPNKLKIGSDDIFFTIEFSYLLTFDKPIALAVHYPILVNNKPLDKKWLPKNEVMVIRDPATGKLDINRVILTNFDKGTLFTDILIRVPNFDQFTPSRTDTGSKIMLLSILLNIDPKDPYTLFNIKDLSHLGLPDEIVQYLLNTDRYDLFTFTQSLFYLELYENNYIKNKKMYKDSDGNIKTEIPLDVSKTYHILFNVITNRKLLAYCKPEGNNKIIKDEQLMASMGIKFKDDHFALVGDDRNITGY